MTQFTYERGSDGTDETFDVLHPDGAVLTSIPYWEDRERAEAAAKRIVDAMNAFHSVAST